MSANGMQFIHIYIFYSRSPLSLSLWCFWAHTSHFASRGRSAESHHKNYPLKLCSVNKFYIVCTWQLAQWLPRKMKHTHAFCAGRHSVVANNHVRVQARHNTIATPLITVATALPIFGAPVNAWRTKFPPLDECILSRTVFRVASAHQTLDGKLLQLTIKLAYFSHVWLCGLFECVLYVFSLNPKMNSALAERACDYLLFFFCVRMQCESLRLICNYGHSLLTLDGWEMLIKMKWPFCTAAIFRRSLFVVVTEPPLPPPSPRRRRMNVGIYLMNWYLPGWVFCINFRFVCAFRKCNGKGGFGTLFIYGMQRLLLLWIYLKLVRCRRTHDS